MIKVPQLEHKADINVYLIKEFLGESIREIRLGVEEGLDVTVYAKINYGWQQMREIRLGLERRVDVSVYAKELYRWQRCFFRFFYMFLYLILLNSKNNIFLCQKTHNFIFGLTGTFS